MPGAAAATADCAAPTLATTVLQGRSAVLLGESGNVLMMRGRARDEGQWMTDARTLVDVGAAAYRAVRAKDLNALTALEAPINASCVSCHKQYRPNVHPRS